MDHELTPLQHDALALLARHGGSLLTTTLPDKTEKDVFGMPNAGISVYRAMERKGLCYFTEEDLLFPDEPGMGSFTPSVEITKKGRRALRVANKALAQEHKDAMAAQASARRAKGMR